MLDGIDPGQSGPQDSLRPMGMRGDLAAEAVSVSHNGLHLFQRVLRSLRIVTL